MEIPQNKDAEISLIGSLLLDGEKAKLISLEPADFYDDNCKGTYIAMQSILNKHGAIDQITVAHELHNTSEVHLSFLSQCLSQVATSLNAEYYADIIKQCSINRKIISMASKLNRVGYNNKPIKEAVKEAQELVSDITKASIRDEILTPKQIVDKAEIRYNLLTKIMPGISTGLSKLDDTMGGLFPGEYIVLAARPGLGKTTLALQIAVDIAKDKNVLFLSMEQTDNSITDKRMVSITGKKAKVIRHGNYSEDTLDKLIKGLGELAESNLYLVHGKATINILRGYIEKMKTAYGVFAVFVDHIQLFDDKAKTRYEAITTISRELALMSKDYNLPIVALSQLSRGPEARENKHPQLSDLRESGALEQDADTILFLYREGYYSKDMNDHSAELSVSKNRHTGELGKIMLYWDSGRERYYQK